MKRVNNFLVIFFCVVSTSFFTSCSGDDENITGFIEVTIDGETRTALIEQTAISSDYYFKYIQGSVFDDINFMLTTYYDLNRLASSPAGEYRFCPLGVENLDFDIDIFDANNNYINIKTGTHFVTSIKKDGSEVIVEGYFNGILEDDRNLSGKYRIIVW